MGNVGVQTTAGHAGIFFVYGGALQERRSTGICMILFLFFSLPHLQIHVPTQSERTHLEALKEFVQRKIMFNPETTALDGKCKAITLQAWTDPDGSRKLRLPDFKKIDTGKL
jgi:hypothetical protein